MRAAVLVSDRRIDGRHVPTPACGPGELLVRVAAAGVCGSDLATWRGRHPYKRAPVVLGHELCGTVVQLGAGVTRFAVGDLVCAAAFAPCDACDACRAGDTNRCGDRANLSHLGWEGGFAEYVVLRQNMTFLLPAGLDVELGALVEPLTIGLHAVRLATPPARRAVILGSGSIGLACLIAARRRGIEEVLCVDLGQGKEALARRLGATGYVDAAQCGDLAAAAGPADVTFVASGHPGVLRDAAALTRPGGQVVVVSYFEHPHELDLNPLVSAELTVRFSALSTAADFAEVIGWLAAGDTGPLALITHRFPLAATDVALATLDRPDGTVGKVMLRIPDLES